MKVGVAVGVGASATWDVRELISISTAMMISRMVARRIELQELRRC
jgi:hypothetical protein